MTKLLRLRRHTEELRADPGPIRMPAVGWAARLERIGLALDATGIELNHTAIVMDGDQSVDWAFISAVGWRQSLYHARWVTLAMRVHAGVAYELHANAEPILTDALLHDPSTPIMPLLSQRYRAIGALLDGFAVPIHAPSIIEMGGGVVVNALVWEREQNGDWELASVELTDQQIEESVRAIGSIAPAPMEELLRQA